MDTKTTYLISGALSYRDERGRNIICFNHLNKYVTKQLTQRAALTISRKRISDASIQFYAYPSGFKTWIPTFVLKRLNFNIDPNSSRIIDVVGQSYDVYPGLIEDIKSMGIRYGERFYLDIEFDDESGEPNVKTIGGALYGYKTLFNSLI